MCNHIYSHRVKLTIIVSCAYGVTICLSSTLQTSCLPVPTYLSMPTCPPMPTCLLIGCSPRISVKKVMERYRCLCRLPHFLLICSLPSSFYLLAVWFLHFPFPLAYWWSGCLPAYILVYVCVHVLSFAWLLFQCWCMGLLWWVQPNWYWGVVCRCPADNNHSESPATTGMQPPLGYMTENGEGYYCW